jgi:hypothetical protein
LILVFEKRFGEYVNKLGEMFEMFCHLGGEHHINDTLPHNLVTFPVESYNLGKIFISKVSFGNVTTDAFEPYTFEYVDSIIVASQFESEGCMMRLEYTQVVI